MEVVDDGIGGAHPLQGTGLRGLADRLAAVEGRLTVESPPVGDTRPGRDPGWQSRSRARRPLKPRLGSCLPTRIVRRAVPRDCGLPDCRAGGRLPGGPHQATDAPADSHVRNPHARRRQRPRCGRVKQRRAVAAIVFPRLRAGAGLGQPRPRRLTRMSELAEGTVTFLLCDIEGSTRLVHTAGAAYPRILGDKRRILREALASHGGTEIDAHGDELFAGFAEANAAAAAAISAQRSLIEHSWPEGHDVRVRMGLHSGEPIMTDEGYTGIDVHRAARIGSAGHGGQILVSEAAYDLLDGFPADRPRHPPPREPARARADSPAAGRGAPPRLPPAAEHDRDARKLDDGGDRRRFRLAARGSGAAARGNRLRSGSTVRQRRRPAAPRRAAQARRCHRRHSDAADTHGRRTCRGPHDSGDLSRTGVLCAVAVRRAGVRGRAARRGHRRHRLPARGPDLGSGGVRLRRATRRRRRLRRRPCCGRPARRPPQSK